MLDNIVGLVPLGKRSLNELLSVDILDIGYSQDRSRLLVGKNVWLNKTKQQTDTDYDDYEDDENDSNKRTETSL